MAGKEASFARNDSPDPLSSSVETTADFDALERAADSIRPAWDGVTESPSVPAAPAPPFAERSVPAYIPASAPVPPAPPYAAGHSPSAADSTHRMRAQLPASAQLDELDDLRVPGQRRSWLVPGLVAAGVLALAVTMLLRSGEPSAAPQAVPQVVTEAPAATAPQVVPPAVVPAAPPMPSKEMAATAQPEAPTPVVEPAAPPAPPVDKAAAARSKRRDKRVVKPVAVKPAPVAKKPVAAPKPPEPKRKGVGFVSDNPYQ